MLEYEWGNSSSIVLSGEGAEGDSNPSHAVFDPYAAHNFSESVDFVSHNTAHFSAGGGHLLNLPFHHLHEQSAAQLTSYYDSRVYGGPPSSFQAPAASMLSLEPFAPSGFVVVPKSEPAAGGVEFSSDFGTGASRIGLNLGGRTYFASSEDDFVNRLYRRSRNILDPGSGNSPRCQAEGCNADLTHAKHYHRRHKVCEFHSKAATVVAAGLTQRFCQQCSRFHLLTEFDNGKRSCRKRLADHNRRRRKSQQPNQESKSQLENSSADNLAARSPPDSEPHPSSVTVAFSPPRMSLDSFGHKYKSTASTSSGFFSTGS